MCLLEMNFYIDYKGKGGEAFIKKYWDIVIKENM